ncbi:unnamed protein product [Zymoseptoria tritici ST99CH_1A5]|uniref:Uncharacterized protein n=1 Tax=Zymoseptoria tritici ST99CH_1A5 TaxID=1276529 RepID=A0A1Y6LI61_ZYMTR|nr:unnamed protein product [Zymoseptoria tritici ST99CH_1A5]
MSVNGQDLLYDGLTDPRPAVQSSSKCRYEIVAQIFGCEGVKVDKFEEVEKGVKGLVETDGLELMNLIVSIKPTTVNGGSDEGFQCHCGAIPRQCAPGILHERRRTINRNHCNGKVE